MRIDKVCIIVIWLFCGSTLVFGQQSISVPVSTVPIEQTAEWAQAWWMPRHEAKLDEAKKRGAEVELLFVGDSITHALEESSVWAENFGKYNIFNLGFSGDRTEHVLWRFEHGALDNLSPKVTVLMIGTNNTGQGDGQPAEGTIQGIEKIIDQINKELPETHLIVQAIFPRDATSHGPNRLINDEINRALPALVEAKGAEFLNINSLFLDDDGSLSSEIMPDLLHPNELGRQIWADGLSVTLSRLYSESGDSEKPAASVGGESGADDVIRLLVRSDDMGMAHSVNLACLDSVINGIARSIEVIAPSPWFLEAVEMLSEHPDIDVGIHLALTSEWAGLKWGPVLKDVPSLVDENGHFYSSTKSFLNTTRISGTAESGWKLEEAERELRAQIEMCLRLLDKVTHMSAHMGTATSTPELRALVERLADEYQLPIGLQNVQRAGRFGVKEDSPAKRIDAMVELVDGLTPGLWLLVDHPGLDTPEMRAIRHTGYENVAEDRAAVTDVFTSPKVKAAIERRGIKLVSYSDVLESESAK